MDDVAPMDEVVVEVPVSDVPAVPEDAPPKEEPDSAADVAPMPLLPMLMPPEDVWGAEELMPTLDVAAPLPEPVLAALEPVATRELLSTPAAPEDEEEVLPSVVPEEVQPNAVAANTRQTDGRRFKRMGNPGCAGTWRL